MTICHICNKEEGTLTCVSCHKLFCEKCVSSLDRSYCTLCVDFQNTKITSYPLVDEDGVTHQGRKLILTGESWMRSRDVISRMTDVELEAKLVALKQSVREAEMVLDFRKITLSQVESEKGNRYSKKLGRRRLIGAMDSVHKSSTSSGTKINGSSNPKVEIAKDALKSLKGLGLNDTAIANLLLKLSQGKKP